MIKITLANTTSPANSYAETYIRPKTRKAPHQPLVAPLIQPFELGIHGAPALTRGEEVLERLDDEGRVAVEFSPDRENGDFAVGEAECACEDGAREHGGDGDVCWMEG